MLVRKRTNRAVVASARRRQLVRPIDDVGRREMAEYRIWQWHTRGNAATLGNTARYPGCSERWGAALAAARANDPLEGSR